MARKSPGKSPQKRHGAAAKRSSRSPVKKAKVSTRSSSKGGALLLVGTMKGAFVLRSDKSRKKWKVEGPHFRGEAVYALLHDNRGDRPRTFAATNSMHWGPTLRTSTDNGVTWSEPGPQTVRFPAESGRALAQIWQIAPGRKTEPDVFYCGVEPAALFESRDGGETWEPNKGLLNHEHQPKWQPGGGGLCLHTIVLDPNNSRRMAIAM